MSGSRVRRAKLSDIELAKFSKSAVVRLQSPLGLMMNSRILLSVRVYRTSTKSPCDFA